MQNGSLGRLLNLDVRAYNDGIAFRYIIPSSTPLLDLLIKDEETEFQFARDPGSAGLLPFATEIAGAGQIVIAEVRKNDFPEMHLEHADPATLVSRLKRKPGDPRVAFRGVTPFTGPWRVVVFGYAPNKVKESMVIQDLPR